MKMSLSAMFALSLAASACARAPESVPAAPAVSAPAPAKAAAPEAKPVTPERPALSIATLDGTRYDLAAKRGRWIVVNFWATWCGPCLKEMPELDALDAERDDVEVIGLAYEEIEIADMRAFLKKRPVKYPIAIVDTYDPPADFPTPRGLPMTHVIAPDGRIAKQFMGPVTKEELLAVVEGGASAGGAR